MAVQPGGPAEPNRRLSSFGLSGSTPLVVAAVLALGVLAFAVLSVSAEMFGVIGTGLGSDPGLSWNLGTAMIGAARFATLGVVVLLFAAAALWWQVGLLTDATDDDEQIEPEERVAVRRVLRLVDALFTASGVAALVGLAGVVLLWRESTGSPVSASVGSFASSVGELCLVLAVVYAGRIAVRSMKRDVHALEEAAREQSPPR